MGFKKMTKLIDMQVVNGEALQAFAVGSTKETEAILALLNHTHMTVMEAAASRGVDFAKALSDVALETMVELESERAGKDPIEHALLVARVRRGFTLISFLTGEAIPKELVLIDHITTRAAEAALITQKQLKEAAAIELENAELAARGETAGTEEKAVH
jgi:hypothetical protein